MTVIWLVEMVDQSQPSVYYSLANDFPVRRIASIESLGSLYKMESRGRRPDLVICRQPKCDDRLKILACTHVLKKLSHHCTVALSADSSPTWQEIIQNQDIPRIELNLVDGISLKAQIELLIELKSSDQSEPEMTIRDVMKVGDIAFCRSKSEVRIHGAVAESLLPKEARIFEMLAKTPNFCVARSKIAELVWPGVKVSDRTLDSHVSRLRRKLESSFECGIESVYGEGYKLRIGSNERDR